MIRKDLIIAVIATFCLTATLFLIVPTRSQGVGEYNSWADYNDDGVIDIFDIVPAALSFGATGDSTKNVSVTNWPINVLAYSVATSVDPFAGFDSPYISVSGYSKVSICIYNDAADDQYTLYARHRGGSMEFIVDYAENMAGNIVKTYDVPNEQVRVHFFNVDASSRNLILDIYLIR